MIKARMTTKSGRDIVLLGLSHKNIEELMKGNPIKFGGEQLQLGNIEVVIHADKDEQSIVNSISESGIKINGVKVGV